MAIRPELRNELLTLSREDRHELADELYESSSTSLSILSGNAAWSLEIEQRVEAIVAGQLELLDADEVHAELRNSVR